MPRNSDDIRKKVVNHKEAETTLIMITSVRNPDNSRRRGIVENSLLSMLDTTEHIDRDVLVWDNGSCEKFRLWLLEQPIDYLCMSENVGITSGVFYALRLAPGIIVSISDDDVYFDSGWYETEREILETFPGVTTVCGYPVYQPVYEVTAHEIELDGVRASTYGGHCQFLGYRQRIQPFAIPVAYYAYKRYKYFDNMIDGLGGLRLSTPEPVVWHMGFTEDEFE